MFHVAKALMSVQALYGIIPNIYGKGDSAKVAQLQSNFHDFITVY